MAAVNDVTGDSLASKATSDAYRDNHEKIFGSSKKESKQVETVEVSPGKFPRLAQPAYTLYASCEECTQVSILDCSVYIPARERPRDIEECLHCGSKKFKMLTPADRGISTSGSPMYIDSTSLGRGKLPQGFQDVMRSIHARTPGSQLDKTSSLMKF